METEHEDCMCLALTFYESTIKLCNKHAIAIEPNLRYSTNEFL
jgi:hypothetical protein